MKIRLTYNSRMEEEFSDVLRVQGNTVVFFDGTWINIPRNTRVEFLELTTPDQSATFIEEEKEV